MAGVLGPPGPKFSRASVGTCALGLWVSGGFVLNPNTNLVLRYRDHLGVDL